MLINHTKSNKVRVGLQFDWFINTQYRIKALNGKYKINTVWKNESKESGRFDEYIIMNKRKVI